MSVPILRLDSDEHTEQKTHVTWPWHKMENIGAVVESPCSSSSSRRSCRSRCCCCSKDVINIKHSMHILLNTPFLWFRRCAKSTIEPWCISIDNPRFRRSTATCSLGAAAECSFGGAGAPAKLVKITRWTLGYFSEYNYHAYWTVISYIGLWWLF